MNPVPPPSPPPVNTNEVKHGHRRTASTSSTDSNETVVGEEITAVTYEKSTTPTSDHSMDAIPLSPPDGKKGYHLHHLHDSVEEGRNNGQYNGRNSLAANHLSNSTVPSISFLKTTAADMKPPKRHSSLIASAHLNPSAVMATHHRRRRSRRHSRIDQFPDLPNGQLGERIALGLFILHLIIMMAIVSLDLAKLLGQKESTPMLLFIALKQYPVIWLLLIPVPVIFGVLATFVWQAMVRIAAVRTLRITTLLSLILPIVASIIIALFRQWHLLVITILLFFVISFSATRWWKSILYASVMLREVNSVAIRRVGLWMTTVVVSLLLAGYTLLCYSVLTIATTVQSSKILSFFVLIFVFLSFLWTFRITIHFIRLVATRVFAACYWPTKSDLPSSHLSQAIHHSLAHAIKFGGALCYGSLFPTIYPNGFACRRTGVLARMAAFHDYTFVYVAVVGKCFYPSGWESRTLIHTRRMSSAYNQSATSGLLLAAVAAISIILTYAIRFVIFYATSLSSSPIDDATLGSRSGEAAARLLALFVALIAVITVFVAMEIARTGVLTLLMSIAVDPSHFRYDHNDFWDAFSAVYPDFDRLNVPISKNIRSSYIPSVIIELTRPKPAVVTNHY